MRIYVGNLSYETTDADLTRIFEDFGRVGAVQMVVDRETNRPRGFAFVDMPNPDSANAAIAALNNTELQGRKISVTEARPKAAPGERPAGPPPGRGSFRPERPQSAGRSEARPGAGRGGFRSESRSTPSEPPSTGNRRQQRAERRRNGGGDEDFVMERPQRRQRRKSRDGYGGNDDY